MKKRMISILMVLTLTVVSLAGCGGNAGENAAQSSNGQTEGSGNAEGTAEETGDESAEDSSSLADIYAAVPESAYVELEDLTVSEAKGDYTIGVAMTSVASGWFKALYDDLNRILTDAGCKVLLAECQDDVNVQVSQLENFMTQKVDAVIINPCSPEDGLTPTLEKLYQAGIPVITVDNTPAEDAKYFCACLTDAYQLGYLVGEELGKQLLEAHPEGEIPYGVIGGIEGVQTAHLRNMGAIDGLASVDPEGRIVQKAFLYSGGFDEQVGLETAQDMLTANPDLMCIVGTCDSHIVGASRAAEALNLENNLLMGAVDGSKPAMENMIAGGPIKALGVNSPTEIAQVAGKAVLAYLNDGTLPAGKAIRMEPSLITEANVDEWYSPDLAW